MKISGEAFYLSSKKYGESSCIIFIFSRDNGLIKGFSRLSKNKKIPFSNLDKIDFTWSSRNQDGLGFLDLDLDNINLNKNKSFLFFLIKATASELCLRLLAPQQTNIEIYDELESLVNFNLSDSKALISKYIFWEKNFLKFNGYGLNIEECSVSGANKNTYYISPKTGNAVSYEVGKKYEKKLFKIPNCFKESNNKYDIHDYLNGLKILEFFIKKNFEYPTYNLIFRKQLITKIYSLSSLS